MKRYSRQSRLFGMLMLLLTCLASCSTEKRASRQSNDLPPIFPDYTDITIPKNIAPLNFCVPQAEEVTATFTLNGKERMRASGKNTIRLDMDNWHALLAEAEGQAIEVQVSVWNDRNPEGLAYRSFRWHVAKEEIDPWIAYRLIPPGYEQWNKIGIYQRNLASFDEKLIFSNKQNDNGCVNCHSFNQSNPSQMMLHVRSAKGGTLIAKDGKIQKVELNKLPPNMNGSYPAWHPSGRFIVFSSNVTRQSFYSYSREKIEGYDLESNLIVYDTEKNKVITDKRFTEETNWETFPSFSPDGNYLYYCTAVAKEMPKERKQLMYALCRVPFDAESGETGFPIDTIHNPYESGGSASHPRVSPDGRYLMYTETEYGTLPLYHKESDLQMIELATGKRIDTSVLNSNDTESYHVWSRNGRWVMFSSKRIDSRYTRLFFSYMTPDGHFSKPFLLPQEDPGLNTERLYAFNVPEFITGEVKLNKDEAAKLFSE